jgi:hypothetical protein
VDTAAGEYLHTGVVHVQEGGLSGGLTLPLRGGGTAKVVFVTQQHAKVCALQVTSVVSDLSGVFCAGGSQGSCCQWCR